MKNLTNKLLWAVYIALLLVLLPHTIWMFLQFEPTGEWYGILAAVGGAIAFEAAIGVLTHKLAKHIEQTPKIRGKGAGWIRFSFRYLNAYSVGLLVSVTVSALANLAHSAQFGKTIAIFAEWGIQPKVYQFLFGAILPVVSLLFARVLSNTNDAEDQPDPELMAAKEQIKELRSQLKDVELRSKQTEQQAKEALAEAERRVNDAEARFKAIGDLFALIFAPVKRDRIIAIKKQWPKLPNSAIAIMAEAQQSTVSEVLKTETFDVVEK